MKYQISSRSFLGSAVLAASLASGVALAAPHDPRVDPGATATPGTISLSRSGLPILGSYLFSVTNGTPANLNFVTVTATTVVQAGRPVGTVSAEIEAQVINLPDGSGNVVDPSCTLDPAKTTVTCSPVSAGTLAPGKKLNFVVVIKSPEAGGSTELNWTFAGSEGNSTNGCCTETGTATTTLVDATSSAAAKHVQSFVKATTGGTVFTGNAGVATKEDPWATTVVVPGFSFNKYTTIDVKESSEGVPSCSPVSLLCKESAITIPTNPGEIFSPLPLLITFQQHPFIIKSGSKIENWVISYSKKPGDFPFIPLQQCSPGLPVSGTPCIDSCKEYTKKSDPSTPALWGIFQCKANASDNGSYQY